MTASMDDCWARALGRCAGGMTGEHILAKTLFSGDAVTIRGAPWCRGEERRVGLQSFTANILCKRHNEQELADLDRKTKAVLETFTAAVELYARRGRQRSVKRFRIKGFHIDGDALERSLLRATINVTCAYQRDRVWSIAPSEFPPTLFVRYAFGLEPIRPPHGLYIVPQLGQDWNLGARAEFSQLELLDVPNGKLEASVHFFHGYRFLWWLCDREPPPLFPSITDDGMRGPATRIMRHPRKMKMELNRRLSHVVHFDWPAG